MPSRLIGEHVRVRIFRRFIEMFYAQKRQLGDCRAFVMELKPQLGLRP
jgi:hypothetical protein